MTGSRGMGWLLAGAVGLAALVTPTAAPAQTRANPPLAGAELLAALRGGGYVIYFRHADTDRSQNDSRMSSMADCANQRNLVDAGREALPLPAGNLSNFDDRWAWIDNDMLPRYQELLQDPDAARGLVSSSVADRAADFRKLPDLPYPGG